MKIILYALWFGVALLIANAVEWIAIDVLGWS